jgi:dTDP-4-dehydrorhamnose 3,5-epimerase
MRHGGTALPGVLLLEPRVFRDSRGTFMETWRERRYREVGVSGPFVQDNVSASRRGVLRGLHVQHPHPQGKLVSVLNGEVWDVAVDVRVGSPTFGRWLGCVLSAENARQLWIPEGFAHGFVALADASVVHYKCTDVYRPEAERTVRWDDPAIGIEWPIDDPVLSERDLGGSLLAAIPEGLLPRHPDAVLATLSRAPGLLEGR